LRRDSSFDLLDGGKVTAVGEDSHEGEVICGEAKLVKKESPTRKKKELRRFPPLTDSWSERAVTVFQE